MDNREFSRAWVPDSEAEAALGVGPRSLRRLKRGGAVPSVKIGGRRLIPRAAWSRLLQGLPPIPAEHGASGASAE